MQTLQIQLLGGFRLLYNNDPVRMVHQLRLQSLLAYLVMHRDLPQSRQHLAFLFWPDTREAQARANLRKVLYDLRKLLPSLDHFVQIEEQFLQWRNSAAMTLDVELFAASVAEAEQSKQPEVALAALEQAVALYAGDLLPACYDDWVLREREDLRQKYVTTLEQLIGLLEDQRKVPSALTYAQRLLHCDPLHESAYRLLMRLHVLNGDRASALRVYHTCVTHLQKELGVEPSPETEQLFQRLLNVPTDMAASAKSTPPAVTGMLPLVGREPEWKALRSAWQVAISGIAHFVLITGEAGYGKTRLAEELLQWADRQGYAIAYTRSYAAEGTLAYAPLTELLRSEGIRPRVSQLERVWLVEVARLLPELLIERPELPAPQPLTDSWQHQRFREALARGLLQGDQPLLIAIDDLQWCDQETLQWLRYLLRYARRAPLLVVGTLRAEEIGPEYPVPALLADLRQSEGLTEIGLGPLNAADTTALAVYAVGHDMDAARAASLFAETEGVPLFIVETVRAGNARTQPIEAGGSTNPARMQAVIQARLARLSAPAREVAELAATAGRAFSTEVLAQAGDGDEVSLVHALDELWRQRIIRGQGESAYDFSHDKFREAAYAGISPARRRLLHSRVAQALEQVHAADLGIVSGQIAMHYESAGLLEKAVLYCQRAADVAQLVYAHIEAIHHLNKGVALLERLPVTPDRLRQTLKLYLALTTAWANLKGNSAAEMHTILEHADALSRQIGDDRQRVDILYKQAHQLLGQGQMEQAYTVNQQALALAQLLDSSRQIARIGVLRGVLLELLGHWRASQAQLEATLAPTSHAWRDADYLEHYQHEGVGARRHLGIVLWHLGYPDQARRWMDEAVVVARKSGHPFTQVSGLVWSAWLGLYCGQASSAQSQAEEALALSTQWGFAYRLSYSRAILGAALIQQNQVAQGITRIHAGLEAQLALNALTHRTFFLALLAEGYDHAGQAERGLLLLEKALALVEDGGERSSLAELHRWQGVLLQHVELETNAVESCFLRALDVARQQEAKSLELRAAINLSRLWQQQGRLQEARDLLAEIYGWFTEGFSTLDLVEARALLEELS